MKSGQDNLGQRHCLRTQSSCSCMQTQSVPHVSQLAGGCTRRYQEKLEKMGRGWKTRRKLDNSQGPGEYEPRPEWSPRESKSLPPEGQGWDCQGRRLEACGQDYDSSGWGDCPIRGPSSNLWAPPMASGRPTAKSTWPEKLSMSNFGLLFKILLFPFWLPVPAQMTPTTYLFQLLFALNGAWITCAIPLAFGPADLHSYHIFHSSCELLRNSEWHC